MPVGRQKFTINRKTFKKYEELYPWIREHNHVLFEPEGFVDICRNDILQTNYNINPQSSINPRDILEIIYWGYPRGMRGTNLEKLLPQIDTITKKLNELRRQTNLSDKDYIEFHKWTKTISGFGISTYSKFLYFSNIRFNGIQSVILDQTIIDTFRNYSFKGFSSFKKIRYDNAHKYYLAYLNKLNSISKELNTNEENIEQFLFIFGKNLK